MNAALSPSEKGFAQDQKTFEQLPAQTKELLVLQEQAEKSTGTRSAVLAKTIREKSKA